MSHDQSLQIYNHFLGTVHPLIKTTAQISRYGHRSELTSANPLCRLGAKVYSQNDEDGITIEILRRLELHQGTFAEFGVGNGTENNTLVLVASGWRGFWVGGETLAFNFNPRNAKNLNFHFRQSWITLDNVLALYEAGLEAIRGSSCDVVSIDLDGNDYHLVAAMLEFGIAPSLFIAEYNAKFRPPIQFVMPYDEAHQWKGDDYFGASLSSFVNLFERHGYFLACCNATGANAFFVRKDHHARFPDVPKDLFDLYEAPKYFLTGLDSSGHPASIRTIEHFMSVQNPGSDIP